MLICRRLDGSWEPLDLDDPLSGVFSRGAQRIENRLRASLKEQQENLQTEVHREIVRVRSQCEKLVERYAERLHTEKKEAQLALGRLTQE